MAGERQGLRGEEGRLGGGSGYRPLPAARLPPMLTSLPPPALTLQGAAGPVG